MIFDTVGEGLVLCCPPTQLDVNPTIVLLGIITMEHHFLWQ